MMHQDMKNRNVIFIVAGIAFLWIVFNHYNFSYSCKEYEKEHRGICSEYSSTPNGLKRDLRDRSRPDFVPDVLVLGGAGILVWILKKNANDMAR